MTILNLNEMAIPHRIAKQKIEGISNTFNAHWVYVFMLKLDDSYKHWRDELATYCEAIDKIKTKPHNKRLDRDFLVENLLYHIDTNSDAKVEIVLAWALHEAKSKPLPDLESLDLTDDKLTKYRLFRNAINKQLEPLFLSKEDHTKEFYQELIDNLVDKYI